MASPRALIVCWALRIVAVGLKATRITIASPLLKCVLPGSPVIDPRFQQDVFGASLTYEDQPRLTERAFEIAPARREIDLKILRDHLLPGMRSRSGQVPRRG